MLSGTYMPVWGMLTTMGTSVVLASRTWKEAIFMSVVFSYRVQFQDCVGECAGALLRSMAHPFPDAPLSTHIHIADVGATAAYNQGIHERIRIMPAQGRRVAADGHDIGEMPGRQ